MGDDTSVGEMHALPTALRDRIIENHYTANPSPGVSSSCSATPAKKSPS
ncbi:MAG TPA: hypothetical protein V6C85_27445 [Allocoleopsis sp.]